jgi:hypothetical protein
MFNYLGTMPSQVDHEINHCTGKFRHTKWLGHWQFIMGHLCSTKGVLFPKAQVYFPIYTVFQIHAFSIKQNMLFQGQTHATTST